MQMEQWGKNDDGDDDEDETIQRLENANNLDCEDNALYSAPGKKGNRDNSGITTYISPLKHIL